VKLYFSTCVHWKSRICFAIKTHWWTSACDTATGYHPWFQA